MTSSSHFETVPQIFVCLSENVKSLGTVSCPTFFAPITGTEELTGMLADFFDEYKEQLDIAVSLPGINLDSAMEVLAEISPKPQASFDTPQKICKWAGLSPRNDDSADKIICRKTLHGNPYMKSILVQCAWAAVKTRNSEFQKWFWPRQCRLGRKKTIIAVARKLLFTLYTLLSKGLPYSPPPKPAPVAV